MRVISPASIGYISVRVGRPLIACGLGCNRIAERVSRHLLCGHYARDISLVYETLVSTGMKILLPLLTTVST